MKNLKRRSGLAWLALSLALVFGLLTLSVGAVNGELSGDGSADAPYEIADAADLAAFRDLVNATPSSTANAVLVNDIDLENKDWTRISDFKYVTEAYAGTFDGAFHTIKGLNVNATTSDQGLFGPIGAIITDKKVTAYATIKNLSVEGTVSSTNNYVGGIAGRIVNGGKIENCSFTGTVSSSGKNANIGGIVGYVSGSKDYPVIEISGCVNHADVITAKNAQGSLPAGTIAGGVVGYAKFADITNCYNTGSVSGVNRAGGIGGQLQNNIKAENCYNIGNISGTSDSTQTGELAGFLFSSASFKNSYYKEKALGGGTGKTPDCGTITDAETLLGLLGDAFVAGNNINDGYPILAWETSGTPIVKEPKILLSDVILDVNAGYEHPTATLSVLYKDMDTEPAIVWSIESGENVIELIAPVKPTENNSSVVARVLAPGRAVVKAQTEDGAYSATCTILAIPQISGRKVAGTVAVGFTVEANISVLGAKPYDYDTYPELSFQWKYLTQEEYLNGKTGTNDYHAIKNATARTFTIPEELENCYLSYTVTTADGKSDMLSSPILVRSHDAGVVASDRAALTFDTEKPIKENGKLSLAASGENGSQIVWESSEPAVIDDTGVITLPKSGISTVTLTARLTYGKASDTKTFVFTVYSEEAIKAELADKEKRLATALESARKAGTFKPVYGTDTNITDMLAARLAAAGEEISLAITDIETLYDGASIDKDGTITYFFADPNTAPSRHSSTIRVTFDASLDSAHKTFVATVVIPWDRERVETLMREEIADKLTLDVSESLTKNITLPALVENKKWALVSWTSSDAGALSIKDGSNKTRPYTGVVHRGKADRNVTLTAVFTFGFTSYDEPEIVLYQTFDAVVAKLDDSALETIRVSLEEKLAKGFANAGLHDAYTGEKLTETDGVYTVKGDIKYPTTRDFGIDGALVPVSITSSNENVIRLTDVNNAARTSVYRPMVGEEAASAAVTLTLTDKESGVSVSKELHFSVLPLTNEEIEAEKALMEKVLENYFVGIRGKNTDKGNIRYNLNPFAEVYEKDGNLVWVRSTDSMVGHGIVPTALDNWQALEAWRLFRSSNAAVVTHENLLVTMQNQPKAVKIDSALSSETLGKYGKLYKDDPETYAKYAPLADLYYREVSVDLVVRGRYTAANVTKPEPVEETVSVSFTLKADKKTWISDVSLKDLPEGTSVFDVFTKVLDEKGYTYGNRGGYIYSVTKPDGTTLAEFTDGKYSGWLYKVNGKMPDVMMSAYGLKTGDEILVYYTKNYMNEFDSGSSGGSGGMSTDPKDDKTDETGKSDGTDKKDDADKSEETKDPDKDTEKDPDKTPEPPVFTDIDGHWASENIQKAVKAGYMNGMGDGLFAPDGTLTRAMFVTVLYRLAGSPETEDTAVFTDVSADAWYAKAVAWAVKAGVVKGISETEFAPDAFVTREQMALMLYRYGAKSEDKGQKTGFTDIETLSEESVRAIEWAFGKGIITGMTESEFAPEDNASRAQAATIFVRFAA